MPLYLLQTILTQFSQFLFHKYLTSTYCTNSIGEHAVVNSVTIGVKLLTSWICEQGLNQNIRQVFLKFKKYLVILLAKMKCFVILCNDYLLPAFDNVSQHKQNIGKRAYMQKFSSRTCANKKPKQKKILLSLRFLHCNHNNYNVHCSITGRLGMAQLRCALRRMDGGLKLLVPEIWGASFLQVHRMTKISHLWPPRFQEGTALMPEK